VHRQNSPSTSRDLEELGVGMWRAVFKATVSGTSVRPSTLPWCKARLHSAGLTLSDVRHTL
jgi:hypothetical protein